MTEEEHSHQAQELQSAASAGEEAVRHALTDALRRVVAGESVEPDAQKKRAPPRANPASSQSRQSTSDKPINFNAAMVRALLAGHKTQTRRPIRPVPVGEVARQGKPWPTSASGEPLECRLASPGMRLWVREPWQYASSGDRPYRYEADVGPAAARQSKWRPGRFLARDASRLTLEVHQVRPERLTHITPHEAAAEGMPPGLFDAEAAAVDWFRRLWDTFYGNGEFAWKNDPWVWVIEFRVRKARGQR